MTRLAIALDLGTSGFRAQALDLAGGKVLSTAITTRHPLPGSNVIDHLHFAVELGVERARDLIHQALNQLLGQLQISLDQVLRLAICGNPTQLSLFQGIEIRDLAFAGSSKLRALGIEPPERLAAVHRASEFSGLHLPGGCEILIPPAVGDEVGADALALILQSNLQDCSETAVAIDYGTNAEMVLIHEGQMVIGSAAAGPALEGQHLSCGSLAMPGAITDLEPSGTNYRLHVLSGRMQPQLGALIELSNSGQAIEAGDLPAITITGTGVIAALDQALAAGLIVLPQIRTSDQQLHFGPNIYLTETDLAEAGKAIGAIRAGYFTLSTEVGIGPAQIRIAYLAGASGTYMDPRKSGRLGLIPPRVETVHQLGNTSLAMARELAQTPEKLDLMSELADKLRQRHCMFARSKTFSHLFLLELSHWTEGMPMMSYREMLGRFGLPDLPQAETEPRIVKTVERDITDHGPMGMVTLDRIGQVVVVQLEGCLGCLSCMECCPTAAISIDTATSPPTISLTHALCNGVACRRCEPGCEPKVFELSTFFDGSPSER